MLKREKGDASLYSVKQPETGWWWGGLEALAIAGTRFTFGLYGLDWINFR
jgi:hypothetical protein